MGAEGAVPRRLSRQPESEDEGDGEEYIPGTGWHTVWYLADGTTSYEPPVRVTAVQEIQISSHSSETPVLNTNHPWFPSLLVSPQSP